MDEKHNPLDIIREIGTIGAGRAATALSEMVSAPVEITVPEVKMIETAKFAESVTTTGQTNLVLVICMEGQINGRMFFILSPDDARLLGSVLLGVETTAVNFEDSLFQSSIKEALNIIVGAYMMALSEMTGFEIMFGIPFLALDVLTAIFIAEQMPMSSHEIIYIKTNMQIKNRNFDGVFIFFPDMPSINKIFSALGVEHHQS
ncbi:MAG: hypothetical protein GX410_10085 [Elusimicrobia bacterium]|nr:hypothetical protein [Elusimicrobiota bacterium]